MASAPEPRDRLEEILEQLAPELRPGRFVFVDPDQDGSSEGAFSDVLHGVCEAWVREPEGSSAVLPEEEAKRLGLDYESVWAWITLGAHSDLEAVGLTALVSASLTDAGLSCNVIAGLRHDHLLVPHAQANNALKALSTLGDQKTHRGPVDGEFG